MRRNPRRAGLRPGNRGGLTVNDPLAGELRPKDCAVVYQTPPDFGWPDVARDARYEVTLTYPDGRTITRPAPQNFINWNEALPAGAYACKRGSSMPAAAARAARAGSP